MNSLSFVAVEQNWTTLTL